MLGAGGSLLSVRVAAVGAALVAGGCGGSDGGVSAHLGPVASVPAKERVEFGKVSPGTPTSKTVTVNNDSDESQTLLTIRTGSPNAAITAITGGTCDVGQKLAPDETCTVVITLTPKNAGDASAVLTIDRRAAVPRPKPTPTPETTPSPQPTPTPTTTPTPQPTPTPP